MYSLTGFQRKHHNKYETNNHDNFSLQRFHKKKRKFQKQRTFVEYLPNKHSPRGGDKHDIMTATLQNGGW